MCTFFYLYIFVFTFQLNFILIMFYLIKFGLTVHLYIMNVEFVVFQNLLKKQVETRTADGRRRITPLCIAQLDTG